MKEFFKNIFEVTCYIGLLIGGFILCFIAIIPIFAIILLICLPLTILVLPFMIFSLPFSIIDAMKKCFDKFDIKEKNNDENIVKK
jgi:hypothetical protein